MKTTLALLFLTLALSGCSRGADEAKAKAEFDHICVSQREFLSARKLKGVVIAELVTERSRVMREGLTLPLSQKAVTDLSAPNADKKTIAEKAAAEAGLKDWICPELAENP